MITLGIHLNDSFVISSDYIENYSVIRIDSDEHIIRIYFETIEKFEDMKKEIDKQIKTMKENT